MSILEKITITITITGVLIFGSLYMFQTGKIIEANHLIKIGKSALDNGFAENMDLQVEASNLASLKGMEEEVERLNFVQAIKVEYIPIDKRNLSLNQGN